MPLTWEQTTWNPMGLLLHKHAGQKKYLPLESLGYLCLLWQSSQLKSLHLTWLPGVRPTSSAWDVQLTSQVNMANGSLLGQIGRHKQRCSKLRSSEAALGSHVKRMAWLQKPCWKPFPKRHCSVQCRGDALDSRSPYQHGTFFHSLDMGVRLNCSALVWLATQGPLVSTLKTALLAQPCTTFALPLQAVTPTASDWQPTTALDHLKIGTI